VMHTLKIPTVDQVTWLRKTTKLITLPYNRSEIRASLDAAARLWDECLDKLDGYQGPVPNIHKDASIYAVINAIDVEAQPRNDEANF
jgi:hypothetical protein